MFMTISKKEATATRKVIARIPQERTDYGADPKARNAREIAWVIAREEIALADGLENASFAWAELPAPSEVAEILDAYDRVHDELTARMERLSAEHWAQPMPFMFGGQEVM